MVMSGPGPGGSFGGGARACGGRRASFSLSAAFRTCSSGTCRLTRSRKSRLERGTFSPSVTLSSRPQRVWNDFLSCSSTAFAASNWPPAAALAACSSRLRARLLCCTGAPKSCGASGFSLDEAAAAGGSDRTGEGGARRKRTCRPLRAPPRRSARPFRRPGLQLGLPRPGLSDRGLRLRLRSRPGSGTGAPGSGARGSGGGSGTATASPPPTDSSCDSS